MKQSEKHTSEKKKNTRKTFLKGENIFWNLENGEPEKPHSLQSPITDNNNVFMG